MSRADLVHQFIMAPQNVFGLVWNSRVISFTNDKHEDETWTTGNKIQEKCRPEVSRLSSPVNTVPEASATFQCFNHARHTSGNLKIVIQMPYSGSESEPWQSRAEQATSKLSDPLRAELESLIRRKHNSGSAAPMLFLWKVEKQTSAMPVPGGYVVYILTDHIEKEKKEMPRKLPYWSGLSCLF
ncbi:hypothetical protein PISL3812_08120 [Talaromyces islandicus]|uniref:Uncharacterized protein n=1 Tax=Talaromyces islandicus TaxID=28573 RepID=A0A0U1M6T9_TALIS|nr:hypothetical protein PISL3812_08120 [Talaromyces islandicus]